MLPVVHRELLTASRRRGTYNARVGTALVALVAMVWFYLVNGSVGPASSLGKSLFNALSIFAFISASFSGCWLTSDCVSSEKREGTLGLLFLTDLKGFDILIGKLTSSSFASFYSLLAILPLLSMSIVLGGVTLKDVGQVGLLLANTMFFSLAAGLFVSTFSQSERKALFATGLLIFVAAFWPLPVMWFAKEALEIHFSEEVGIALGLPSPFFSFMLSPIGADFSTPRAASSFFSSVAFVHLEAWLMLVFSGRWLPRLAHQGAEPIGRRDWAQKWRQWSYGHGEGRLRYRRQLLDSNAFSWLAAREQRKPIHVWLKLGTMLALWLPAAWKYPNYFADPETSVGLAFILHGLLKVWFTSEVCARLNEDRHSGGLELLLSTPLGVVEIAQGQAAALRRQFLLPTVFILILDAILLTFDTQNHHLAIAAGMVLLPVDLWALKWVGMWRSLTQPKLDRALMGTWLQVLYAPWIAFAAIVSVQRVLPYLFGGALPVDSRSWIALWTLLNLANSLTSAFLARRSFLSQFRILATTRFDTHGGHQESPIATLFPQTLGGRTPSKVPPLRGALGRHPWIVGCCGAGFALALIILMVAWWGRSRFEAELREIQRRGEPASVAELTSTTPALSGPNQAERLVATFPQMRVLNQFRSGGASKSSATSPLGGPLPEAVRARYSEAVEANAKILRIVREIDDFRQTELHVPWHLMINPPQAGLPVQPWWQTFGLVQLLQAEALLRIDDGDRAEAVRGVGLMMDLSRMLDRVPLRGAQSSRFYSLHEALTVIENLLSSAVPSMGELEILETWLRTAEAEALDTTFLRRALQGERVLCIVSTRGSSSDVAARTEPGMGRPSMVPFAFELMKWTGRWDLLAAEGVRDRTAVINLLDLPLHERQPQLRRVESEIANRPERERLPLPWFDGVWTARLLRAHMDAIARLRAARTAMAVERWRLSSTTPLPETLQEIVPNALEKLPEDPFDGQPLQYTRKAVGSGYQIYGLGGEGTRQNGQVPSPRNNAMGPTFTVER